MLLVLTAQDNQAEVKMVMQAGAKGVILKPFSQDNLLANVERAIANHRRRKFFSVKVTGDFLKVAVCVGLFFC